ncbi:hypothetical protein [Paenimyroides viscosum]|jgi:hypothetical protein|uniref:Uncharacterized protein n=1 Tax=Paenimyroides viscosum TaxID=2488729 RepID=A0A3P1B5V9_9FLAO|nr:hypothetical protein [Paenimyroides viscosum]RRA96506.1 hypothetical protein EG242_02600 [Paenimyroides viscosum]
MNTVTFTEQDFKETLTGFVFTMQCNGAENRKFGVEALQPDGSYEEINVVTKAKNDIFEIHEQPFVGRVLYV